MWQWWKILPIILPKYHSSTNDNGNDKNKSHWCLRKWRNSEIGCAPVLLKWYTPLDNPCGTAYLLSNLPSKWNSITYKTTWRELQSCPPLNLHESSLGPLCSMHMYTWKQASQKKRGGGGDGMGTLSLSNLVFSAKYPQ